MSKNEKVDFCVSGFSDQVDKECYNQLTVIVRLTAPLLQFRVSVWVGTFDYHGIVVLRARILSW